MSRIEGTGLNKLRPVGRWDFVGQPRGELGEAVLLLAGRGTRTRARRALPWLLASFWIALALFCTHLVGSVRTLRTDVEERVSWLIRTEANRSAVTQAVHHATDALPHTPDADRARLALAIEYCFDSDLDTTDLRKAVRVWRDAPIVDRAEASRLLAHEGARYDEAAAQAILGTRGEIAPRSERLARFWDHLYVLAAVCLLVCAAFSFVLIRSLHQTDRLTLGSHAQRQLIETAQSVIFVVSLEGKKVFINEASQRIYGYAPSELIGKPFHDLIVPELRERDLGVFSGVLQGESVFNYETVSLHKSGRRIPMLYNASLIRDGRGNPIACIGTGTDMSDVKAMQQKLLRSERQHAFGTLASGVAHDFNNKLTVILGHSERELSERKASRRLRSIRETAERARTMVERLLVFSERRAAARTRLDLAATARQMEAFLDSLLGDKGNLGLELPDLELLVDADWSQIEQVLMNLVINARDAAQPDGLVQIRVRELEVESERADELGIGAGSWASVEVSDDGAGMDESTLDRAFEPFFTTKQRGHGTGLGLATVQGIVQQHGGVIHAASRPGEGTVMTVLLPLAVLPVDAAT